MLRRRKNSSLINGVSEETSWPSSDRTFGGVARDRKTKQICLVWIQKSCLAHKKDSPDLEVFERYEVVEHRLGLRCSFAFAGDVTGAQVSLP